MKVNQETNFDNVEKKRKRNYISKEKLLRAMYFTGNALSEISGELELSESHQNRVLGMLQVAQRSKPLSKKVQNEKKSESSSTKPKAGNVENLKQFQKKKSECD